MQFYNYLTFISVQLFLNIFQRPNQFVKYVQDISVNNFFNILIHIVTKLYVHNQLLSSLHINIYIQTYLMLILEHLYKLL
jgi:hypothetical protein